MKIDGSTFIVTGGASGLGEATVRMLFERGANVVIADLHDDRGKALTQSLGTSTRFVHCDVTRETDATAAVALGVELGNLRGLINCAGIASAEKSVGKAGPHDLASFASVVQVNLVGTFNMIRLVAHAMSTMAPTETGERGVLVNTASVAAFEGQIGQAAYAASKGGIVAMTLPIARDLARSGIRCMTIAPGLFGTPMLLGMPPDVQQSLGEQVPFPSRLGKPTEFAQLVEAIIINPMLNGETIRLDGAVRLQPR